MRLSLRFTGTVRGYPAEMFEVSQITPPATAVRVGLVSTFPPTRCGIARFASTFVEAMLTNHPSIGFEVIRLRRGGDDSVAGVPVVMEIDPDSPVSVKAAARQLGRYDLALLQHEFGIYGDRDGAAVVDLLASIGNPGIVVLHTVLPDPTLRQLNIVQEMAKKASIVVLCRSAAQLLHARYSLPPEAVTIIPHGTNWHPEPPNSPPRRRLITWGLLGPGKGIERALRAIAHLKDLDPPIEYRIVGRTHPVVAARSGGSYRSMLKEMVRDLGLSDTVEFVDRYVDDRELFDLVRRSDLVIAPYDNHDQVSSGVISEAVGLGRPVVATRFPHAEEMLASGAGVVVDHDDEAMAAAIRQLLDDSATYLHATKAAVAESADLGWVRVAEQYAALIRSMVPALATQEEQFGRIFHFPSDIRQNPPSVRGGTLSRLFVQPADPGPADITKGAPGAG